MFLDFFVKQSPDILLFELRKMIPQTLKASYIEINRQLKLICTLVEALSKCCSFLIP